mgnify:CR=1 FL=1|jgi:hypothetical protein|tara:strand:- start:5019 stop:5219 length:201 start_codon:yes stop_codon:yes gene_type:complete
MKDANKKYYEDLSFALDNIDCLATQLANALPMDVTRHTLVQMFAEISDAQCTWQHIRKDCESNDKE